MYISKKKKKRISILIILVMCLVTGIFYVKIHFYIKGKQVTKM